jgi:hypothetical protein
VTPRKTHGGSFPNGQGGKAYQSLSGAPSEAEVFIVIVGAGNVSSCEASG